MNWRSTNASTISYTCSNGGGLVLSGSSPNATGTVNASALASWVNDAPVCTWTATGAGGVAATYRETVTTNVATSGEVVTYIHTDALGSPVARTDANGTLISRTRYEPYGATAAGAVPTIGFTGHVNDASTGLVYMQQRYYDPYAGRFLSTDPVLTDANTGASFNRYVYANNNPYTFVDPDGRAGTVAVNRNVVNITIPITYAGPGATPAVIAKFNNGIQTILSGQFGQYTVVTRVTEGADNMINVPAGNGRAFVDGVGGNTGTWPSERPAWTAAHEALHLLGLDDAYPNNGRPGAPDYENDIMGARDMPLRASNVRELIRVNRPRPPPRPPRPRPRPSPQEPEKIEPPKLEQNSIQPKGEQEK